MTQTPMTLPPQPFTLQQIAALTDGRIIGETAAVISGVASVDEARAGDLVFAESARFLAAALRSRASAILTSPEAHTEDVVSEIPIVLVANPRHAFVRVLEALQPPLKRSPGIHSSAQIGEGTHMGEDASIAANVVIGDNVTLGNRVTIFPGVSIGDGCVIGDDTVIYPNAVLYSRTSVGKRCILHANCVVGADGFGYIPVGMGVRKVPQLGVVEIGDDVEVGANSCIDRAKTGATVIGSGTKLDNLVQVAHNVHIGQSCLIMAHVGIAGSTTVGNGVLIGGQAGVKDHVTIGDGARIAANGGVIGNVDAGVTVSGYPARPHAAKMREHAAAAALPEYIKRIRSLEKRLEALEKE